MIGVVFPGQGSQKVGMGKDLAEQFAVARRVYDEVGEVTGIDISNVSWVGGEEELRKTENAQLGLFTASLAAYRVLTSETDLALKAVAGHSVGEFSALVAAGVYSLPDGAKMVKFRSETMAKAGQSQPGGMAAILGLDGGQLADICAGVSGLVGVANDNSPGQVVISGERTAVAAAGEAAMAAGAKRVIPLNVSGGFHSALMKGPSDEMREFLKEFSANAPKIPIYSNVTSEPAIENWPDLMARQLVSPVRWTESVQHLVRDGIDVVIECGVGEVLSGLIKRIDKSVQCLLVNDSQSLKETTEALITI